MKETRDTNLCLRDVFSRSHLLLRSRDDTAQVDVLATCRVALREDVRLARYEAARAVRLVRLSAGTTGATRTSVEF